MDFQADDDFPVAGGAPGIGWFGAGFEFLDHLHLVDVFIKRFRVAHEIGLHTIAQTLVEPDRADVARMGIEPCGGETALPDARFDLVEQRRADSPSLELRQNPEIGDEIIGFLAGSPAGKFAIPFGDQDIGPAAGAEIVVGFPGVLTQAIGILTPDAYRLLPGSQADLGKILGFRGTGRPDSYHRDRSVIA
jgi:hypothetical protein